MLGLILGLVLGFIAGVYADKIREALDASRQRLPDRQQVATAAPGAWQKARKPLIVVGLLILVLILVLPSLLPNDTPTVNYTGVPMQTEDGCGNMVTIVLTEEDVRRGSVPVGVNTEEGNCQIIRGLAIATPTP